MQKSIDHPVTWAIQHFYALYGAVQAIILMLFGLYTFSLGYCTSFFVHRRPRADKFRNAAENVATVCPVALWQYIRRRPGDERFAFNYEQVRGLGTSRGRVCKRTPESQVKIDAKTPVPARVCSKANGLANDNYRKHVSSTAREREKRERGDFTQKETAGKTDNVLETLISNLCRASSFWPPSKLMTLSYHPPNIPVARLFCTQEKIILK